MVDAVTEADFETRVLGASTPVLVDVWAPWCGPCKAVAPIVAAVAAQWGPQIRVVKLNLDEAPAVAQRYGVMGIPTLLFFAHGQLLDRLVGVAPQDAINAKLEPLLRLDAESAAAQPPPAMISRWQWVLVVGLVLVAIVALAVRFLG